MKINKKRVWKWNLHNVTLISVWRLRKRKMKRDKRVQRWSNVAFIRTFCEKKKIKRLAFVSPPLISKRHRDWLEKKEENQISQEQGKTFFYFPWKKNCFPEVFSRLTLIMLVLQLHRHEEQNRKKQVLETKLTDILSSFLQHFRRTFIFPLLLRLQCATRERFGTLTSRGRSRTLKKKA